MTSIIERDFIVKNGLASFTMKEYPNYCGIEDIGYISHGEWADAELEYKGKLFNENVVSDVMWERFIEEFPDKDGDTWKHPVLEQKSREWHIGRIIYFINHPMEIRDIEIDNECSGNIILPQPIIVDGWHRYAAARWLYDQGKLTEIHCRYGGRVDVLEYLQGKTDSFDSELV